MLSAQIALRLLEDGGAKTSTHASIPSGILAHLHMTELSKLTDITWIFIPRMTQFFDLCEVEAASFSMEDNQRFFESISDNSEIPASHSGSPALCALFSFVQQLRLNVFHVKVEILYRERRDNRMSQIRAMLSFPASSDLASHSCVPLLENLLVHPFLVRMSSEEGSELVSEALYRIHVYIEEAAFVSSNVDSHTGQRYDEIWLQFMQPYFDLKNLLEEQIPGYTEKSLSNAADLLTREIDGENTCTAV